MDTEDKGKENSDTLEFLLRDIQVPPDFGGTDTPKTKKPQSLQDFFWDWSGLKDFSGSQRIKCLFDMENRILDSEILKDASTVFFWNTYLLHNKLSDLKNIMDKAIHAESREVQDLNRRVIAVYDALVYFRDKFDLESIRYPDGPQALHVQSYVSLMMVATKLLLLPNKEQINSSDGKAVFNQDIRKLLEKAYQDIINEDVVELSNLVGKDIYGLSSHVAAGIILNSYAHYKEGRGDYLTAFLSNVKAASFLKRVATEFNQFIEIFDYLPCCKVWDLDSDDSEIQRTVIMWEKAKKSPIRPDKWDEIRNALKELDDIAWDVGAMDVGVNDADGNWYQEDTYFKRQHGFCEGQIEQSKAVSDFLEKEENKVYLKRLKKDFFRDSWDYLTSKTQKALLEAELKWDKSEDIGSDHVSIVMEYRRALEIELREAIFSHATNIINSIIEYKINRGEWKSPSRDYSASDLSLAHMRGLIKDIIDGKSDRSTLELKKSLYTNPMVKDYLISREFTRFLYEINRKRNAYEHSSETEVGQVEEIRRRILGIGSFGYLPILAHIKRVTQTQAT